jgi:hypothetical protein
MKKNLFCLSILAAWLFSPGVAISDCTDLSRSTSWYVQDEDTIIFYAQNSPIAQIDLQDCTVSASSTIRLLKTYMCDSDRIVVDGQECGIITLKSLQ